MFVSTTRHDTGVAANDGGGAEMLACCKPARGSHRQFPNSKVRTNRRSGWASEQCWPTLCWICAAPKDLSLGQPTSQPSLIGIPIVLRDFPAQGALLNTRWNYHLVRRQISGTCR